MFKAFLPAHPLHAYRFIIRIHRPGPRPQTQEHAIREPFISHSILTTYSGFEAVHSIGLMKEICRLTVSPQPAHRNAGTHLYKSDLLEGKSPLIRF